MKYFFFSFSSFLLGSNLIVSWRFSPDWVTSTSCNWSMELGIKVPSQSPPCHCHPPSSFLHYCHLGNGLLIHNSFTCTMYPITPMALNEKLPYLSIFLLVLVPKLLLHLLLILHSKILHFYSSNTDKYSCSHLCFPISKPT